MDDNADPQQQSRLFTMAAEIRHAIYRHLVADSVHLSFWHGKTLLSPCVEPHPGGDYTGSERGTTRNLVTDTIWARRLWSSWGPHWKCEEVALKMDSEQNTKGHAGLALLLVCKRMHLDVIDFMARETVFNLTDLYTLNCLPQRAHQSPYLSRFMTPVSSHIRKLDITLKLPLAMCIALENPSTDEATSLASQLAAWHEAGDSISYLAGLRKLRRLRIWLDHDQPEGWSTVNERMILSNFEILLTRASNLSIHINLPLLHPCYEKPERHFVEPEQKLRFEIHRRLRQRFHAVEKGDKLSVTYKADFPIIFDIPDYKTLPVVEVAQLERSLRESGEDINQYMHRFVSNGIFKGYRKPNSILRRK